MTIDTIAAIATPAGRGGIAVIRVSGPLVMAVMQQVVQRPLLPRMATFCDFMDDENKIIDQGVAIYFPAPHSFTGEAVLELQGHGSPVVMQLLLQRIFQLGVRSARPGEFSERAFLNEKIDLTQAEAIADLISAASAQAARAAMHSLQGDFSRLIHHLVEGLIYLRMYVEAALDFPEEEIDFLHDKKLIEKTLSLHQEMDAILLQAKQGALLREGMTVVIAGKPNAGKSSLLNCLSGRASAIVTEIPGTTRDVLREEIVLEGLPLHIVDTAGLRESEDVIEQEGVKRAKQEIQKADRVLWLVDASQPCEEIPRGGAVPLTVIYNKIDLIDQPPSIKTSSDYTEIFLSAKTQAGMDLLRDHLKQGVGYTHEEGKFIARTRHLTALHQAKQHLIVALEKLKEKRSGELVAEELRQAQKALNEITGEFSNEDLLGRIFSSFCIGK